MFDSWLGKTESDAETVLSGASTGSATLKDDQVANAQIDEMQKLINAGCECEYMEHLGHFTAEALAIHR